MSRSSRVWCGAGRFTTAGTPLALPPKGEENMTQLGDDAKL